MVPPIVYYRYRPDLLNKSFPISASFTFTSSKFCVFAINDSYTALYYCGVTAELAVDGANDVYVIASLCFLTLFNYLSWLCYS